MLTLTSPIDIDVPTVINLNNKNNVYEQWRLLYINTMAGEYYTLTFILMTTLTVSIILADPKLSQA